MIADCRAMPAVRAFDAWDTRAWVRRCSTASAPQGDGAEFFPARLVPHLGHPAVLAATPAQRTYLAAQHLYQWLNFTVDFEVSVVNRAAATMANGTCGVRLPEAAAATAYKIYVDEGFHSLESLRVLRQVEASSGIGALPYDFSRFLRRLDAVGAGQPGDQRLVRLLQVVVFETLITAILADIPNDHRVLPVVRQVVADHAIDERRHHAYFAAFFRELWANLGPPARKVTALLLAPLVLESLQPATRPAFDALVACGFAEPEARDIVADAYDEASVTAGVRFAARNTIALFKDCGVLEQPGARDAFARAGLVPA